MTQISLLIQANCAKAAIVVVSLGADRASQIYKYLSEQDIEDLTYEVAKMEKPPTVRWKIPG